MYRTYARGDVRRGSRGRHFVRGGAWLLAVAGPRPVRKAAVIGALAYLGLPLARAWRTRLPARDWWRLPLVVAMKDLSQCVGAVEGLVDEARGREQPVPGH
jgi:hypothetical protein